MNKARGLAIAEFGGGGGSSPDLARDLGVGAAFSLAAVAAAAAASAVAPGAAALRSAAAQVASSIKRLTRSHRRTGGTANTQRHSTPST
ncbi:hypothetical protein PG984_002704 [Apiospora sp. TS-2023a]